MNYMIRVLVFLNDSRKWNEKETIRNCDIIKLKNVTPSGIAKDQNWSMRASLAYQPNLTLKQQRHKNFYK